MSARIIVADVLDGLRQLEPESVQCVVTSPPYWGLRDYGTDPWVGGDPACTHRDGMAQPPQTIGSGANPYPGGGAHRGGDASVCASCGATRTVRQIGLERTPAEYVDRLAAVFAAVWRVLRPDGTLWLNLGDCYNAYNGGSGPGSGPVDGPSERSAQRPQLPTGYGIRDRGLKPKDLVGIPWRVAFALQAAGWWLRSDIVWHKPNPMPESVGDRPTRCHEYLFLMARSERYYYDAAAVAEPIAEGTAARLERAHSGYQAPGQSPHNGTAGPRPNRRQAFPAGVGDEPRTAAALNTDDVRAEIRSTPARERRQVSPAGRPCSPQIEEDPSAFSDTRNRRTVWTIPTMGYSEAHFATFPTALVEPCILAGSRPGDTVLDPFAGAGTVGLVADRLDRHSIGIELSPEYAAMAERRIREDAPLFADVILTRQDES